MKLIRFADAVFIAFFVAMVLMLGTHAQSGTVTKQTDVMPQAVTYQVSNQLPDNPVGLNFADTLQVRQNDLRLVASVPDSLRLNYDERDVFNVGRKFDPGNLQASGRGNILNKRIVGSRTKSRIKQGAVRNLRQRDYGGSQNWQIDLIET